MAHILSNSRSSKINYNHLKKHQSCFKILYLWKIPLYWCSFYRDTRFCHEKDAQNVVTGWFSRKKWSKWCKSSETLHIDRDYNYWKLKTMNLDVTKYNPARLSAIKDTPSKSYTVFCLSWKMWKSKIRVFDSRPTIWFLLTEKAKYFFSQRWHSNNKDTSIFQMA